MHSKERSFSPNRPFSESGLVRASNGLTLLELIIAFVVLQVAIVTFAQIMTAALDFSGQVRRSEIAQLLAQTKMEELIRTISSEPSSAFSSGEASMPRFLEERPQMFEDLSYARSGETDSFMWVAEATPSENNLKLLNVTLYVYAVKKRTGPAGASAVAESFIVSEDREQFTYAHALGGDAVEVISGKERLRISSAAALP
jgi:hypothetical protein